MKSVFLEGKDIYLGPISINDKLDKYESWLNDQELTKYMSSGNFPITIEGVKNYIIACIKSKEDLLLGIFLKKGKKHIGNVKLHQIDWINRHAGMGIIIGDRNYWGKGYATEVINLITKHAFAKLNLRKVYAGVIDGNDGSKRAFEKVGYVVEGVMKEHFIFEDKYLDCYLMAIFKINYNK